MRDTLFLFRHCFRLYYDTLFARYSYTLVRCRHILPLPCCSPCCCLCRAARRFIDIFAYAYAFTAERHYVMHSTPMRVVAMYHRAAFDAISFSLMPPSFSEIATLSATIILHAAACRHTPCRARAFIFFAADDAVYATPAAHMLR